MLIRMQWGNLAAVYRQLTSSSSVATRQSSNKFGSALAAPSVPRHPEEGLRGRYEHERV